MDRSFYKSWLAEEIRAEAYAEGYLGQAVKDVLTVLDVRGLDVPDDVRERITTSDDPDLLRIWHRRAVTASSAEGIFEDA